MRESIRRSARTFFQAFTGVVSTALVASVSGANDIATLKTALWGLAASGVAAGVAAIMNYRKESEEN